MFLKIKNRFGVLVTKETKLYLFPISFQPVYVQLLHFKLTLLDLGHQRFMKSEMEFKEFEPRFKSAKIRFKLSAGLNLETFDTILSGTNHI